jgi:hypothetical protein
MPSSPLPMPRYSRLTAIHRLNWFDSIDLLKHYKIQNAYIVQQVFPYLVLSFTLWALFFYTWITSDSSPLLLKIALGGAIASVAVTIGAITFWTLYRRKIEFRIDGLRLNSTMGIIRRRTSSLVVRAHNLVEIKQRLIDIPFGLWSFQIYGSNQMIPELALLSGISKKDAFDMFRYFSNELSQQVTIAEPKFGEL